MNSRSQMDLKFGKDKKLKSRKRIERLFTQGKRYSKFPLVAVYFVDKDQAGQFKIAVSVPKRKIKKATDRNLIKRRMREAFRRNQLLLKNHHNIEVMFIYTASKPLEYQTIEKAILSLIDFLNSVSAEGTSV